MNTMRVELKKSDAISNGHNPRITSFLSHGNVKEDRPL
jgi:hypothetical protein